MKKRNKFSLSHYKLLTMNMGKLIPLTWYEILPGDSIQAATSVLVRVSPLLAPVMHPVRVRIHHWFVPYRLLWDNWESFITGGELGTDTSTWPHVTKTSVAELSLYDYLGVPPATFGYSLKFSALPLRAYNLIWNEHYRDSQLSTAKTISTADGNDTSTDDDILNVAWEKDFYSTARTDEQLGSEINIPLTGDAPIKGLGPVSQVYTGTNQNIYETGGSGTTTINPWSNTSSQALYYEGDGSGYPNITADLGSVSGVSINDLRLSAALQKFAENRNIYGGRYIEYIRSIGVAGDDARLQAPEYIGGGRQMISFSEILSTDGANTGQMKGHGLAAMRTNRFRKFFNEHGLIMTCMSVLPKAIYSQAMHKKWFREQKEDYWQPELQHLGDTSIKNKEVYVEHATPEGDFGFQERYDEYRTLNSKISAEFHSSLNHWHMARIHATDPSLNSTFIESSPTNRIYASTANHQLYVMSNHSIQSRRLLARRSLRRII